jgi:hypothetical protein
MGEEVIETWWSKGRSAKRVNFEIEVKLGAPFTAETEGSVALTF